MSTKLAVTVVGTVVGAYFGYPQLGAMAGALIGSAIDPTVIQGPKINESGNQTVAEGVPRAIIFGTAPCTGNVIQRGPLIIREVSESQGKGSAKTKSEKAYRTYAIGICEGQMATVLRVWRNNKLVYDVRPGSGMLAESSRWIANKRFYMGGEDQLPAPELEALDPDATAHRGTVYMLAIEDDLTDMQGSIPQYRFEVTGSSTTTPLDKIEFFPNQAGHYAPVPGQYEGDISPVFENTDVFTDWFDVQVVQLEVQVFSVTSSSNTTFTVHWGANTTSGAITGNGTYIVQLQKSIADSVSLELHYETIGADTPYSVTVYARAIYEVGEDLTMTTAYYGGVPPPPFITPDDELYGVLTDPVLGIFSASWGPDSLYESGGPIELGDIVSSLYQRCGVKSFMYDVSEATDQVTGYPLASAGYTAADAVDGLRLAYFFDKCVRDKKIYHPKRGKAAVKTLTYLDLTSAADSNRREQANEIPYKLNVRYPNPDSGYSVLKETTGSISPDRRTTGEVTLDVPVCLNSNQAAQIADKQYKTTLAEMDGTMELPVMLDVALDLAEGDCIGYVDRMGQTYRLRIEQMEFADWSVKLTCKADRQSAYTSDVTGLPAPEPTLPPSTIPGDTIFAILDSPMRTDSEDDISYLAAATGSLPPWYGAELERSLDGGANYTAVLDFTEPDLMGVLLEDITAASPYFTDTTNTVKIQFYRDGASVDSLTESQFLSRQGVFALEKADGSWEYMQARDADEQMDGSFWLTTLHRGIANSGGNAHVAGAKFVWLADATYVPASSSWIGLALTHQATSFGESSDDTTNAQTQTYAGRSQKEWPPAYLKLSRDGSNLITATWEGRGRLGNAFNPVMSRNFTGYRVTVTDGSTTTVTETTSTTYTGTWANPVTVSVVALNRTTGAGPATSGTV